MSLPVSSPTGYLPPGVHRAPLEEIVARFGAATARRQTLAGRLQTLLTLARATGRLRRAFVWGSFVTEKPFPGDLDVFLLMQVGFDQEFTTLPPEQRDLFDHGRARLLFEADVFWATEAIGEEELASWLSVYQLSRDLGERGIVEVYTMIETAEQFERAEEAITKIKRFLLAARRTHTAQAYAALSAPILRELQDRERDVLLYLSQMPSPAETIPPILSSSEVESEQIVQRDSRRTKGEE